MLKRAEVSFNAHVEKVKKAEEYFRNNKRSIFAARMEPRFAPTSNQGQEFETFVSDPNNLFKKSLLPLDQKQLQEEPFRRTSKATYNFREEQASII